MINVLPAIEAEDLQDYPFCIVGSGAAGISLAIALSRKGHRVLLLEAGDWKEDSTIEDAYKGYASKPHASTTEYRRQRFGGTTHLWGGRCVPLDALDLDKREHVANSGWPISFEELSSYYPEAMAYCDAGEADFTVESLAGQAMPMFDGLPSLQPELVERIERYSLPTDFAKKYRQELARSKLIQVVLKARCIRLNTNVNGSSIDSVELASGQYRVAVRANNIILCGGGIETTRMLLCTKEHAPGWSRFDASLGKYYGCHFDLIFGALEFKSRKPYFNFQKTNDGVYARRKLQFSKEFQVQHQLLNSTFRLHFPAYADPSHGSGVLSTIYLAKSVLASEHQSILNHGATKIAGKTSRLSHLRNIVTDLGSVFSFGSDWLFKMKLAERRLPYTLVPNRNGSYPLEFNSEQIPDIANHISLQDQVDENGVKRVSIHWKLTNTDIQSGIESFKQLQRLLLTTQTGTLEFDANELSERMASALPVGGHHIGTTRMGVSDKTSVVDANCQVHGVDNLFVASASVFTTNSHANPTLTIVALALRLCNFLIEPEQKNVHDRGVVK